MTVTLVGSTFLTANRDDPAWYHGQTYFSIQYGFGHTQHRCLPFELKKDNEKANNGVKLVVRSQLDRANFLQHCDYNTKRRDLL
jgi:hypothetical protein